MRIVTVYPFSSVAVLISLFGFVAGCASMTPVTPKKDLSQATLNNLSYANHQIQLEFSSDVPQDYTIELDPTRKSKYDINAQTQAMLDEFVSYKSNSTSSESATLRVKLADISTNTDYTGGTGAILTGNNDAVTSAKITFICVVEANGETIGNQTITGADEVSANQGEYSTWMEMYSDAINGAINKAIFKSNMFIDQVLED